MTTIQKYAVAIYVDKSSQQWVVRDADGNFWCLPAGDNPWDQHQSFDPTEETELDHLAEQGFDWIRFLSVWQTGLAGQRVSRSNPERRKEFQETLPTCEKRTSPGPVSPSLAIPYITLWVAMRL